MTLLTRVFLLFSRFILTISPWFSILRTRTLPQSIHVEYVTRKYMTMIKQYHVSRDVIFGFTGIIRTHHARNFNHFWSFVTNQVFLCFYRICTGLTEPAYHFLTQEVYAEWVCDKCLSTKNIPLVKFKP